MEREDDDDDGWMDRLRPKDAAARRTKNTSADRLRVNVVQVKFSSFCTTRYTTTII